MSFNYCPNCGKEYAPHSAMCPPCNYWFRAPADSPSGADSNFNKRQLAAFVGAVLLLVGLFTPLVGITLFTVNYYNLSQFSGLAGFGFFLLVLCGVGGGVLAWMKHYSVLRWPGLAALLVLAFTFFKIQSTISAAKSEMARNMAQMPSGADNPFKGMGEAFMSMIQMQWGWAVLLIGAVLMVVAGMMKDEPPVNGQW